MATLLTAGCTFTVNKPKQPVYAESRDSLQAQIHRLVLCQHFNVGGEEITTNGKKHAELDIEVVNGQGIPKGDSMWVLGKALASAFKQALQDSTEYDRYVVRFSSEEKSGFSYSKTSRSREFLSKEL